MPARKKPGGPSKVLPIRLTDKERQAVELAATLSGTTVSGFIRDAVLSLVQIEEAPDENSVRWSLSAADSKTREERHVTD